MTSYQMLRKLTLDERLQVMAEKYITLPGAGPDIAEGLAFARKVIADDGWQHIAPALFLLRIM